MCSRTLVSFFQLFIYGASQQTVYQCSPLSHEDIWQFSCIIVYFWICLQLKCRCHSNFWCAKYFGCWCNESLSVSLLIWSLSISLSVPWLLANVRAPWMFLEVKPYNRPYHQTCQSSQPYQRQSLHQVSVTLTTDHKRGVGWGSCSSRRHWVTSCWWWRDNPSPVTNSS